MMKAIQRGLAVTLAFFLMLAGFHKLHEPEQAFSKIQALFGNADIARFALIALIAGEISIATMVVLKWEYMLSLWLMSLLLCAFLIYSFLGYFFFKDPITGSCGCFGVRALDETGDQFSFLVRNAIFYALSVVPLVSRFKFSPSAKEGNIVPL